MSAIRSVLAATDFSDHARHAVARAASLAAERKARLTLLHVMSAPALDALHPLFAAPAEAVAKLVADAEAMLAGLASDTGAGGPPITRVRVGVPRDEILAEAEQMDLLVVGARGSNPVRDFLLGTTAERLLHKTTRPMLTVKRAPRGPYRRVLVPIDFSAYAGAALETALHIAPDADITVLHAFDVPMEKKLWLAGVTDEQIQQYRARARQQALDRIELLIQDVAHGSLRCFRDVAQGDPAPVILEKEAERDADLIVMGKRGQSLVEKLLLGSATRHVLADAKCDVLVVPER